MNDFALGGHQTEKYYVTNDKEACQLLRRKFSGETSMIIRTLAPQNFASIRHNHNELQREKEKKWIVLEILIQPERSFIMALKRGLKINRDQQATVVPAITRHASGAYMLMRFSDLPFDQSKNHNNNSNDESYDDEEERMCVNSIRKSMSTLFPYRRGEKIRVLDVFAETVDEQDVVRFKGSVVVILDGDYYIPQKNMESGLAYISEYDKNIKFECIGPFQYSAYCPTCRTVDSHIPEYCKYFEKEYPGGLFL
ncbi:hypothetical protein BDA99DRAFT_573531 [Phascolomyces articulosus]|uniref:Uncharacterized protein n=1 Tax=Phascolomyces articulosus TaxID=60185 RepID=A0AAD5PBV7_9FUNG|nr:hypothetical protein BDA99DRAFT_573531 [Phascolomyces articulosus]